MWPRGTKPDGHAVLMKATGLIWILESGKCQDGERGRVWGDRKKRERDGRKEAVSECAKMNLFLEDSASSSVIYVSCRNNRAPSLLFQVV